MKDDSTFTIGQLAKAAQVNAQTLRFYERHGILKPTKRSDAKYRIYDQESLRRIRFIKQAKSMGFRLNEIEGLLSLKNRSVARSEQVRAKTEEKLKEVRTRIAQLKKLERTLSKMISDCKNRVVSDCCPILERMGTE